MYADFIERLKGIVTALATPLDADGNFDEQGAQRLVEKVIDDGVSCLFPLGWCGEGPLLTDKNRVRVIKTVCAMAKGRIPTMIGVSEHSLPRMEEMIQAAEDSGADSILATLPYGYELTEEMVYQFFKDLSKRTSLPIIIYENNELGVLIGVECLKRLSEIDSIVGVKATVPGGELRKYYEQLHRSDSFAVLSGDEYLYDYALVLGYRHFTMGGPGNFCAKWCNSMYQDACAGNFSEVMRKQGKMLDFLSALYPISDSAYSVTKYVLQRLGICSGNITSPHRVLSGAQQETADRVIDAHWHVLSGD